MKNKDNFRYMEWTLERMLDHAFYMGMLFMGNVTFAKDWEADRKDIEREIERRIKLKDK